MIIFGKFVKIAAVLTAWEFYSLIYGDWVLHPRLLYCYSQLFYSSRNTIPVLMHLIITEKQQKLQ